MTAFPPNGPIDSRILLAERSIGIHEARFDRIDETLADIRSLATKAAASSYQAANVTDILSAKFERYAEKLEKQSEQLVAMATAVLKLINEKKRPRAAKGKKR